MPSSRSEEVEPVVLAPARIDDQLALLACAIAICMVVMGLVFGSREVIASISVMLIWAYVVLELALCILFFVVLPLSSAASRQDWAQIWRQILRDFRCH